MWQRKIVAMCLVAWSAIGFNNAWAQDKVKEPPKLGWSNSTEGDERLRTLSSGGSTLVLGAARRTRGRTN